MPARRIAVVGLLLALGVLASAAKCIENDQMFVDTEGYTHVIGNMTNETDVSASTVTLSAKLFDANDNVIAEATGSPCPVSVTPHNQQVFDLKFPNPNITGAVRYEVRPISGITLPGALPDPKIFLIRFYAQRAGPRVAVVGQVRNDSQQPYSNMIGCTAVFNNKGKVIRMKSSPIAGTLTPGAALIYTEVIPDVPDEAVQFRLWFAPEGTQWVASDKVTIQN
jgi:hypothetical protein